MKIDEAFEGSRAGCGAHFGSQPGQAGTPNLLKTCTCDQKGGVGERLWKCVLQFFVPSAFWLVFVDEQTSFFMVFGYILDRRRKHNLRVKRFFRTGDES